MVQEVRQRLSFVPVPARSTHRAHRRGRQIQVASDPHHRLSLVEHQPDLSGLEIILEAPPHPPMLLLVRLVDTVSASDLASAKWTTPSRFRPCRVGWRT